MRAWIARDKSGYSLWIDDSPPVLIEDPGGLWWIADDGCDAPAMTYDEPPFGIECEMHKCQQIELTARPVGAAEGGDG